MRIHFLPLALVVAVASAEDARVRIQSADLALEIDAQKGSLVSLRDGEAELLAGGPQPLFRLHLHLHLPDGAQNHSMDSRAAGRVKVERLSEGVRIEFSEFAGPAEPFRAVRAVVTLKAVAGEPGITGRVEVTTPEKAILEKVEFPAVQFSMPLGGEAKDDRLFFPGADGFTIALEGLNARKGQARDYPGNCSMQFLAWYDGERGVSIQCHDPGGESKQFGYRVQKDATIQLFVYHLCPFETGKAFASPPLVFFACRKNWMHAAQHYRRWALKQPFAKAPADRPRWMEGSRYIMHGEFRPEGNGKYLVPLDKWREVADAWKEFLGCTGLYVEFRKWERDGIYASPFYFPLHPSPEAVAATLKDLRAGGHSNMAMVGGLKWLIEREPVHKGMYVVEGFDGKERFEKEGRPVCVVERDGKVHVKAPWTSWDGTKSVMCPGSAFAREHFQRCAREMAAAGFDLFEFDQMNGGECPDCYSASHGHPRGPGVWKSEAIRELIRNTRETGRKINPDFATAIEDPAEYLLPVLDLYYGRQNNVNSWPAIGPGSEVVPAFSYVYHTVNPGGSLDVNVGTRPDAYARVEVARSFIWGRWLGGSIFPWQLNADFKDDPLPLPKKVEKSQAKLLQACARAQAGPGFGFLTKGRMLWAEEPAVPLHHFTQVVYEKDKREEKPYTEPSVYHSAWELEGRRAFFFVNASEQDATFAYGFKAEDFAPEAHATAALFRDGKSEGEVARGKLSPVSVPALSVLQVEFGAGRK